MTQGRGVTYYGNFQAKNCEYVMFVYCIVECSFKVVLLYNRNIKPSLEIVHAVKCEGTNQAISVSLKRWYSANNWTRRKYYLFELNLLENLWLYWFASYFRKMYFKEWMLLRWFPRKLYLRIAINCNLLLILVYTYTLSLRANKVALLLLSS